MRHYFRHIVGYNPTDNVVTRLVVLPEEHIFNARLTTEAFYEVYNNIDRSLCIVVGVSLTRDLYQLSPTNYSKYIREDIKSMEAIDRAKFFTAEATFMKQNSIKYENY